MACLRCLPNGLDGYEAVPPTSEETQSMLRYAIERNEFNTCERLVQNGSIFGGVINQLGLSCKVAQKFTLASVASDTRFEYFRQGRFLPATCPNG